MSCGLKGSPYNVFCRGPGTCRHATRTPSRRSAGGAIIDPRDHDSVGQHLVTGRF